MFTSVNNTTIMYNYLIVGTYMVLSAINYNINYISMFNYFVINIIQSNEYLKI